MLGVTLAIELVVHINKEFSPLIQVPGVPAAVIYIKDVPMQVGYHLRLFIIFDKALNLTWHKGTDS